MTFTLPTPQRSTANSRRRKRVCDAAVEVLHETDNPAVMWGDEGLCHLIAERMGWEHNGPITSDRVLNALAKTPGPLVKGLTRCHSRNVRIFAIPSSPKGGNE